MSIFEKLAALIGNRQVPIPAIPRFRVSLTLLTTGLMLLSTMSPMMGCRRWGSGTLTMRTVQRLRRYLFDLGMLYVYRRYGSRTQM